MHVRQLLPLALVGVAVTLAPAVSADAHPSTSAPATTTVVVRPVTSAGKPAIGFSISHTYDKSGVDCSDASSSPGAVDPNIDFCSPSAASAIACWKAPAKHTVLCYFPYERKLVRFRGAHGFTHVAAPTATRLAPLQLVLTDGTTCTIRDGGAWGYIKSRPQWSPTYGCSKHGDIWTKGSMPNEGINESLTSWTVRTAQPTPHAKFVVRHVVKASFVGTAS